MLPFHGPHTLTKQDHRPLHPPSTPSPPPAELPNLSSITHLMIAFSKKHCMLKAIWPREPNKPAIPLGDTPVRFTSTIIVLATTVLATITAPTLAASNDNTVEWDGLSHAQSHDRSPRVPMNGESYTVRFQAYTNDLTSARVLWDDGSANIANASVVSTRGPYDIWEASIPATTATSQTYIIELQDGSDIDYLGPNGVSDAQPATAFEINTTTLVHAPLGSTPVTGGTVFKVWSPSRPSCNVRGEFNGWSLANPMTRQGENFVAFIPNASAGQMYKYFFPSGSVWKPDANAHLLVPSDNYNTVIIDQDAYVWNTNNFSPAPMEELVIYQLHVGTFAGRNDPAGFAPSPSRYIDVAARASHLADLGVNAVMLNPINEFPGEFSGGYNPISAHAIESKLGNVDDFKSMVDALHAQGIAVLLDIVWNHFDGLDNYQWNYDGTQIYFDNPVVDTPWGAQHDYNRIQVRNHFLDSINLFMGDYRLDGYRVDAVMSMVDAGWTPQYLPGQAIMRGLNNQIDQRYVDKHTIAEKYDDDTWTVGDSSFGLGFDAQYHNTYKDAIRGAIFTEAANGNPNMGSLAAAIDGTNGSYASKAFNYFELHDDAWPLNNYERAVRQFDPVLPSNNNKARGLQTLGNGITLMAKGVPAILQGTEWLEDDGWEANKIDWSHKTTNAGVFKYYSDLIALRTTKRALFANSNINIFHVNDNTDVLAFERSGTDGRSYVIVANISPNDLGSYTIGLPRAGQWGVLINNDAVQYDGGGFGTQGTFNSTPTPRDGFAQQTTLQIPAYGFMVLQHNPELPPCSQADFAPPFGTINFVDVSAFVAAFSNQSPTADINGDGIISFVDVSAFVSLFSAGCP